MRIGFIIPPPFMRGMKPSEQFALWKELCTKYPALRRFGYAYLVVALLGYLVFFFVTMGPMTEWFGYWVGPLLMALIYIALDELIKHLIVAPQIKTCLDAEQRR